MKQLRGLGTVSLKELSARKAWPGALSLRKKLALSSHFTVLPTEPTGHDTYSLFLNN